ncbi:hypothetical protein, partial [Virgibacillus salexigens]
IVGKSFKLKTGKYISTDKKAVISDLTISRESINTTIYTDKSVNVFYNPVTTYDNQIMTNLSGTHQLSADKMAKTN